VLVLIYLLIPKIPFDYINIINLFYYNRYWYKLNIRKREALVRDVFVNGLVILFAFSWTIPTTFVASFLNLEALKKTFPWLAALAEKNKFLQYFIQGPLPTLAIVSLNAVIPQSMECKFVKLLH
jgi:hypothetical protein